MKTCNTCKCANTKGMETLNQRLGGNNYIWCNSLEGTRPIRHACRHWKDKCVQCKGLLSCDKGE